MVIQMGIEYELYCQDCKEKQYLGKNASELAEAAIKGVAEVRKLWGVFIRCESGSARRLMLDKYQKAKSFAVIHTKRGHKVIVVEDR